MTEEAPSDATLLRQLQARHPAALETLYDRYAQTTYNLICRIVGEPALATEILIETFWHLWQEIEHVPPDPISIPSWLCWLYRLARQKSLAALQAQSTLAACPSQPNEPVNAA